MRVKRYSEGEFLRKIRRCLMSDGLQREIRLIPRPTYRSSTSQILIELRTTQPDGTVLLRHHNTGMPGTSKDVERIRVEHLTHPGLTNDTIAAMLASVGPAVETGDGLHPLIVQQSSDMPLMVLARATLHDIAMRPHERTLSLPSGPVAHWWKNHDDIQTLELGMDRARRSPKGSPRPLRIDGGLAEILRGLPDGAERLESIIDALDAGVDQGAISDDHTPITIAGIGMTVGGLQIYASSRGLKLKNHAVGGATLTGTILHVPQRMPETLLMAVAGYRLDAVVTPPPLDGGIRIVKAAARQNATALTLDLKSTTLADLRKTLAMRSKTA